MYVCMHTTCAVSEGSNVAGQIHAGSEHQVCGVQRDARIVHLCQHQVWFHAGENLSMHVAIDLSGKIDKIDIDSLLAMYLSIRMTSSRVIIG